MGTKVSATYSEKTTWLHVFETESGVRFEATVYDGTAMTTEQARELARQLYRLARRVDKRKGTTT